MPCFKGSGGDFVLLRVPFAKNGGGLYLNQYTTSCMLKFRKVNCQRGLFATVGWDQWSTPQDGDDKAQLWLKRDGKLSAADVSPGGSDAPSFRPNAWHAVSLVVDAGSSPTLHLYIDGSLVGSIKTPKASRDGQFTMKRQLALFFSRTNEKRSSGNNADDARVGPKYIRSAAVHARVLDADQLRREHAILHALLIDDAIAASPSYMHAPLTAAFSAALNSTGQGGGSSGGGGSSSSTRELRQKLRELLEDGVAVAARLWNALLAKDSEEARALTDGLQPCNMAVCARWRRRDGEGEVELIEESTAPYGETLLHAAAFAGDADLIRRLVDHGAPASRRGVSSGCTALHAAASAGQLPACRALLSAGCKVGVASSTKRTALHLACLNGLSDVAILLVQEGGADPHATSSGGESAMAVLRRLGRPESLELYRLLDAMSGERRPGGGIGKLRGGGGGGAAGSGSSGGGVGVGVDGLDGEEEESGDEDEDESGSEGGEDAEEKASGITQLDANDEGGGKARGDRNGSGNGSGGNSTSGGGGGGDGEDPGSLINRLKAEAELSDNEESGSDDDGEAEHDGGADVDDSNTRDRLLRQAKEAAAKAAKGEDGKKAPQSRGGGRRRSGGAEDDDEGEEGEYSGEDSPAEYSGEEGEEDSDDGSWDDWAGGRPRSPQEE